MATRRLVTRIKGRLTGTRSALRVAAFPRLKPLPVTAPAAFSPTWRGRPDHSRPSYATKWREL